MNLKDVEQQLGFQFPESHRRCILDPGDPIHERCDFLVPESPYPLLSLLRVNERLHQSDWDTWPRFLIAFASNGCGDFFAYDIRVEPPRIIYLDPDRTVTENLHGADMLAYDSFDAWYASKIKSRG